MNNLCYFLFQMLAVKAGQWQLIFFLQLICCSSWYFFLVFLLHYSSNHKLICKIDILFVFISKRFDKIHDDAKNIWHYEQYLIVRKYFDRSAVIPPISVIVHLWEFCYMLYNLIQRKRNLREYRQIKVFST